MAMSAKIDKLIQESIHRHLHGSDDTPLPETWWDKLSTPVVYIYSLLAHVMQVILAVLDYTIPGKGVKIKDFFYTGT
jgi:hypothetical protein